MMWDLREPNARGQNPPPQWPPQHPRSLTPSMPVPIPVHPSQSTSGRVGSSSGSEFLAVPGNNEFRPHSAPPGGFSMPSPSPSSVMSLPVAAPALPVPELMRGGYQPHYIQLTTHHHHHKKKKHHKQHHSQGAIIIPVQQLPLHKVRPVQAEVIPPASGSRQHRPSHSQPGVHHLPPPKVHQQFSYSTCKGRKKALCIGINYFGSKWQLRGCVNDAKHVRDALIACFGYKRENIVLLTDDAADPRNIPTRRNIINAFRWLVQGAQQNDSLFLHYSGHGGQTKDRDGDEVDGFDEVIYPVDYRKAGHIVDDEMHSILVKPLPRGCRLTGLFDSCHSGTVLDLPYIYSSSGRMRGSHVSNRARQRKDTSADVISWSGCKDSQTSADTFAGGVAVGAMSWAFISVLKRHPRQSYQQLLANIREVLYAKYTQKPQLGSSHPIDTSLEFVI